MLRVAILASVLFLTFYCNVYAEESIRVVNLTGREICEFYISAHNEDDWGDDLFESLDRCIRHEEYADVTWNDTWANTSYDLRVVYRNGKDWVIEDTRPNVTSEGRTEFVFHPE